LPGQTFQLFLSVSNFHSQSGNFKTIECNGQLRIANSNSGLLGKSRDTPSKDNRDDQPSAESSPIKAVMQHRIPNFGQPFAKAFESRVN